MKYRNVTICAGMFTDGISKVYDWEYKDLKYLISDDNRMTRMKKKRSEPLVCTEILTHAIWTIYIILDSPKQ